MAAPVIIGLGKTGLSVAHYYARAEQPFIMMDTRANPPLLAEFKKEFPKIPLFLGALHAETLNTASAIILSPGLPSTLPEIIAAQVHGVPVIGDIELFACAAQAPIIAITGSNGKSTVTTLVGELLRGAGKTIAVGGNLGLPALDLLVATANQQDNSNVINPVVPPDFYVLELSSFQLETTFSLQNHIACVLNVSDDHMDRYADLAEYAAAKQRIYANAANAIVYAADAYTLPHADYCGAMIGFGLEAPSNTQPFGIISKDGQLYLAYSEQSLLPVADLKIKGQHNWLNALASLALVTAVGVDPQRVLPTLASFAGLAHRCEWVSNHNDIDWYNDSKGTNVGATLAALSGLGQSIPGKIIWIAGGQGKGADFSPLRGAASAWVRAAFFIGQDAALLASSIGSVCPCDFAGTLSEAVQLAAQTAQPGDVVLLSPACASLDMFSNFEDRGNQFKHLVKEILQ